MMCFLYKTDNFCPIYTNINLLALLRLGIYQVASFILIFYKNIKQCIFHIPNTFKILLET